MTEATKTCRDCGDEATGPLYAGRNNPVPLCGPCIQNLWDVPCARCGGDMDMNNSRALWNMYDELVANVCHECAGELEL